MLVVERVCVVCGFEAWKADGGEDKLRLRGLKMGVFISNVAADPQGLLLRRPPTVGS